MNQKEHFKRLNNYYIESRIGYDLVLGGSKHFGFYPKNKRIFEREAQILMQDLIAKKLGLSKRDKVLDAGCGQGIVSTYLSKKFGCKIEGITIPPFEIKKAKFLADKLKVSNKVHYSLMDYSDLKFKDNYFDCIYTMESLSHSINIKKTLKEFYRVLKKRGRIALFEYSLADDNKFSSYEKGMLNKIIYSSAMDGLKEFRHNKFQEILKEIGFKNIKVENISENVQPSLNRLRRFALIPYFFVKLFGLQENHPNLTAAVEFCKMAKKDLIRYNIFTAER